MILTMNQDCLNSKNELQAIKGEKVELISDAHLPVLLLRSLTTGNTFSVRESGTDYEEQKKKHETDTNSTK